MAAGALCFHAPAFAHPLKLATWNLDWLTLRHAGDPAFPSDVFFRTPDDMRRLAHYADKLDADVIGIEEVDGANAASAVFSPSRYTILISHAPIVQQVGLVVRKGIPFEIHPEITALDTASPDDPHQLRTGLDVTVGSGAQALRILVVHLKTGCWDQPPGEKAHSCPVLKKQFAVIEDWILERQDEGEAFAVIGDFNRRLTLHDPLLMPLMQTGPLTLVTAGRASPCDGGEYFIDHILLGNAARTWLNPDSLRVMTYKDDVSTQGLSDHCPVSVRLNVP